MELILVKRCRRRFSTLSAIFILIVLAWVPPVWSHGGKNHAGESFTALQALQKATELYDRLIINGKLDATWETDLTRIDMTARDNNGRREHRVGFHRDTGSPEAVYIFFSPEGKYSGSNFDGEW